MMGREVRIDFPLQRIVSLVPSQTEYLIDIGAPVVGRTKFCVHPSDKVNDIPIIGGTKNFRMDAIKALQPDLIIGNKEENYQDGIAELSKNFPVWMSDIYTLEDAIRMMQALGTLCNKQDKATSIVNQCESSISKVKGSKSGSVVYLIWKDPWMAAGKDTFIDHMLKHLGYTNSVTAERYPELSDSEIVSLDPEYILFSSEPYPFKQSHLDAAQKFWPDARCMLVDGELYSWYGSRLRFCSSGIS